LESSPPFGWFCKVILFYQVLIQIFFFHKSFSGVGVLHLLFIFIDFPPEHREKIEHLGNRKPSPTLPPTMTLIYKLIWREKPIPRSYQDRSLYQYAVPIHNSLESKYTLSSDTAITIHNPLLSPITTKSNDDYERPV
jgi:hypothetical protein